MPPIMSLQQCTHSQPGEAAGDRGLCALCRQAGLHMQPCTVAASVPEGLDVHREARHRVCEGCIQRIVRPALEERLQAILPSVQCLQPIRWNTSGPAS